MQTEEQTYNGWTNYETWNVKLWLDSDEGSYRYVRELADEAKTEGDSARRILADQLKDMVEDSAPDLGASMFADLLGAALSEVNWFEIAENILGES